MDRPGAICSALSAILNASFRGCEDGCLLCGEVNELASHATTDCAQIGSSLVARIKELEAAITNIHKWTGSSRVAKECVRLLPKLKVPLCVISRINDAGNIVWRKTIWEADQAKGILFHRVKWTRLADEEGEVDIIKTWIVPHPVFDKTDPRVGNLTRENAEALKNLAEEMGGMDGMPAWMRDEIEAKTQPNSDYPEGISR